MKHYNIPIFIPHLGCPHNCIFCNQKKITGREEPCSVTAARQEVERYLSFLSVPAEEIEISFFGGSFTAIPVSQQIAYLAMAQEFVRAGRAGGIRLSTRPDAVEADTLKRLKEFGATTVELGVQSFFDPVLKKSGRGHSARCAQDACRRVKEAGFSLGVQLMCGLPGDSLERSVLSAKKTGELKADFARIYPVLVLAQTPLEDWYRQGLYQPLSLSQAVIWAAEMTRAMAPVPVIRTGLCMDGLEQEDVIAGPVHPAFGELVASKLYDLQLEEWLEGKATEGRTLVIFAPQKEFSKLAGQRRRNLEEWKKRYGLRQIRLRPGDGLKFLLQLE